MYHLFLFWEQFILYTFFFFSRSQLQEYRTELDVGLPDPLNTLGRWIQHIETVLSEDSGRTEDHVLAARNARDKQEQLKVSVQPYVIMLQCVFLNYTCVSGFTLSVSSGLGCGLKPALEYPSSLP